jgi:hypothetical protein
LFDNQKPNNERKKTMRRKSITIAFATIVLAWAMNLSVLAQDKGTDSGKTTESVNVGSFSVDVPTDWKKFTAQESAVFEREYRQQSREIYQHYAGGDDPSKSVHVAAYHTPGNNGSFVIVSMSLPAQADLMPMLKEQIEPKMKYGIQQGFIKKYLGMVSVDRAPLTGFYTKAIGSSGDIQVSGGLEHSKKKNTILQLTLLAPDEWKEEAAVAVLEKVLASVKLRND